MAAMTLSPTQALAPAGPMLVAQTRVEVLKRLRSPMALFATIALPVVLFALLGLGRKGDVEAGVNGGRYMLASFAAYGVSGVMFMTFGLGVSVERAQKINVLMRATPAPPWVLLTAKIFSALVQAAISMLALFAFAIVIGGVHMPATMALSLFVRVVFGSLPLLAAGFALGYTLSPSAAPAVANLIYLVLSFFSGFYAPISEMGPVAHNLAPYLPTYRFGELAWDAMGARTDNSLASNVLWLAGYTVIFSAIAIWGYRRDEQKTFG
jgi:ABC-2 type transport system permease protein